ncbi:hypothetical protein TNCV_2189161 [Trichonephila clavipes]|nr:hypothetical protein TNCV_2189161 [Trichonephila clavipes]
MWPMVAQQLTQVTPPAATPDQLWQRMEATWSAVPQEHIQSLFESMPRREPTPLATNRKKRQARTRWRQAKPTMEAKEYSGKSHKSKLFEGTSAPHQTATGSLRFLLIILLGSLGPKKANSFQPNPEAKRDYAKDIKIMATPGSSFTPTPLGHEDNLELSSDAKYCREYQMQIDTQGNFYKPHNHMACMCLPFWHPKNASTPTGIEPATLGLSCGGTLPLNHRADTHIISHEVKDMTTQLMRSPCDSVLGS